MAPRFLKKAFDPNAIPIVIFVILALCIGLFVLQDYGASIDEVARITYAHNSINAFRFWIDHAYVPDFGPQLLRFSGASFDMIIVLLVQVIQKIAPNIQELDIWHYSYFIYFLITGLCLYGLAKRWFSRGASWGVLILFTTQPLIWGHSFINHTDIPFMGLFILNVYLGFRLADSLVLDSHERQRMSFNGLREKIKGINRQKKKTLFGSMITWFFLLLLIVLTNSFSYIIDKIVRNFYYADPFSWAGKVFYRFAQQASNIQVEDYIAKFQSVVVRLEILVLFLGAIIIVGYLLFLMQIIKKICFRDYINTALQILKAIFSPRIVFAGMVFGLTISIRILGPLSGLITVLYLLLKSGKKSLPIIISYILWACFITYLTWPYLWLTPVGHYIESLKTMSSFPWPGTILFNGEYYPSTELPFYYLPYLLNIQLTEPFLICFYIGFGLLIWKLYRKKIESGLLIYIGMGLFFPTLIFLVVHTPFYDNFRHVLFLLPPMFLIAGFTLEFIINRIKNNWVKIAVITSLMVPGVLAGLRLHPYEYIYYNELVDGTRGAFRRFEMDYWNISFREIAKDLNRIAPENSKVVIWGAIDSITPYLRSDLIVEYKQGNTFDLDGGYAYAVQSSRWEWDTLYPEAPVVALVERNGAILSVLKYVQGMGP